MNEKNQSHEDVQVSTILIHPGFKQRSLRYDIAVIILKEPQQMKVNINTICLSSSFEEVDTSQCYSSGWGNDVSGNRGKLQQFLKKLYLPIKNRESCEEILKTNMRVSSINHDFKLDSTHFCAGGNGQDSCKGDGGSALVCRRKNDQNRFALVGVTSWGLSCNIPGIPGVYASAVNDFSWISRIVNELQKS